MTPDTTNPVPVDPVHAGPETPWEPPLAGNETEALPGALDRLRWTFRQKSDGLDAAGLGGDRAPGWRPVAGDSAVWDG